MPAEGNHATENWTTVSGGKDNQAGDGTADLTNARYATVSGGNQNRATSIQAVVGGGVQNTASGSRSTISGGENNTASGDNSTIGGGENNTASGINATVSGGEDNIAIGDNATVIGGIRNLAIDTYATVLGGHDNTASGIGSYALGSDARSIHSGAFVWADASGGSYSSTGDHQFRARVAGGAQFHTANSLSTGVMLASGGGSWSSISDRNMKENYADVDEQDLLERLAAIPVKTWNYKTQDPSIRHIGPTAQDFHAAFGVGPDDKKITTIDADGVALAAIQGLYKIVMEQQKEIQELKQRLNGGGGSGRAGE